MSEFDRIALFFAPLAASAKEAVGLLDDAAFITPKSGETWVITTDAISEGVHFVEGTSPDLIARKLMRTNLSDLAAKGAVPRFYTLNIMLPDFIDDAWIETFAKGLAADQQQFNIALIGGDSIAVKGEHASFSITAFGVVEEGKAPLKRSGANIGDVMCVSGTLGESAIGLALAQGKQIDGVSDSERQYYKNRYLLPEPRLSLGNLLLGRATSCMDISDGLVQDAGHIGKASEKKILLEASAIPTAKTLTLEQAITHGDDYELLFTVKESDMKQLQVESQEIGLDIIPIGRIEAGEGVVVVDGKGNSISFSHTGWQH